MFQATALIIDWPSVIENYAVNTMTADCIEVSTEILTYNDNSRAIKA